MKIYKLNDNVFKEGDQCDYVYVIKEGDFYKCKKVKNDSYEYAKELLPNS